MWTIYRVRWECMTQLCASVPGSSGLIEGWLRSRAPATRPPNSRSLDEVAAEVLSTVMQPDEAEEGPITLVFQRVEGMLAVRMATIKAHLKDCAYQLQTYLSGYMAGEKALRVKVANGVYWPTVAPILTVGGTPFVPILRPDGTPCTEPTGVRQKAIHVMTPMGQRNALKAFEYVEDAVLEFPLAVLTAPERQIKRGKDVTTVPGRPLINDDDLKTLFTYGGMHGYGGERSEDGGRYACTFTREEG